MPSINRNEYIDQFNKLVDSFSSQYKDLAKQFGERVLYYLEINYTIENAIKWAEKDVGFFSGYQDILVNSVVQAAAYGYGILPQMVVDPQGLRKTLLNESWTPDDMPLSKRLHGTTKEMRDNIINTVRVSMKNADTFKEMARNLYNGYGKGKVIHQADLPQYLQDVVDASKKVVDRSNRNSTEYQRFNSAVKRAKQRVNQLSQNGAPTTALKAAYSELLNAAETLSQNSIEKAINTALQEKSRYHAERIARTEMARAMTEGFLVANGENDDVVAYKWKIGSRHPKTDICDFHAQANLYALGNGVYPKDRYPHYPAHPHCHCHPQAVFIGELSQPIQKNMKYSSRSGSQFLRSLSAEERANILGVHGSKDFMSGKVSWENVMRNWQGHKNVPARITKEMMTGEK